MAKMNGRDNICKVIIWFGLICNQCDWRWFKILQNFSSINYISNFVSIYMIYRRILRKWKLSMWMQSLQQDFFKRSRKNTFHENSKQFSLNVKGSLDLEVALFRFGLLLCRVFWKTRRFWSKTLASLIINVCKGEMFQKVPSYGKFVFVTWVVSWLCCQQQCKWWNSSCCTILLMNASVYGTKLSNTLHIYPGKLLTQLCDDH